MTSISGQTPCRTSFIVTGLSHSQVSPSGPQSLQCPVHSAVVHTRDPATLRGGRVWQIQQALGHSVRVVSQSSYWVPSQPTNRRPRPELTGSAILGSSPPSGPPPSNPEWRGETKRPVHSTWEVPDLPFDGHRCPPISTCIFLNPGGWAALWLTAPVVVGGCGGPRPPPPGSNFRPPVASSSARKLTTTAASSRPPLRGSREGCLPAGATGLRLQVEDPG